MCGAEKPLQHIKDLLQLIVLNYKLGFCTKVSCSTTPASAGTVSEMDCLQISMYSLIICVEATAWDLTETDRFSLQNVNHALEHINSAYQLGCVQPVGIFGSV